MHGCAEDEARFWRRLGGRLTSKFGDQAKTIDLFDSSDPVNTLQFFCGVPMPTSTAPEARGCITL
jgi:hypothetical protein